MFLSKCGYRDLCMVDPHSLKTCACLACQRIHLKPGVSVVDRCNDDRSHGAWGRILKFTMKMFGYWWTANGRNVVMKGALKSGNSSIVTKVRGALRIDFHLGKLDMAWSLAHKFSSSDGVSGLDVCFPDRLSVYGNMIYRVNNEPPGYTQHWAELKFLSLSLRWVGRQRGKIL